MGLITDKLIGVNDTIINYLLVNEGGWTVDQGGATMWGVTIPFYKPYLKRTPTAADIRAITKEKAADIYRVLIWEPHCLNLVTDPNIACCILDTMVNRGESVGARYTQMICNVILDGDDIKVDGRIGPKTVAQVNKLERRAFIKQFEALEVAGYEAILAKHPEWENDRNGWMNRAHRLNTLLK